MNRIIVPGVELAAALSGIPGLTVASGLLREIVNYCNEITVNKEQCKELADKCGVLLQTYSDQARRLEGSELLQNLDEVTNTLQSINSRLRKWARYNAATRFIKKSEIEAGIKRCLNDVDNVTKAFEINALAILNKLNRELVERVTSNHSNLLDFLERISSNQEGIAKVLQIQGQGEHLVEPLIGAGQKELRMMRSRLAENPNSEDPATTSKYNIYQDAILGLHHATGIPPTIRRLDGEVEKIGVNAEVGGVYCDVWIGLWLKKEKVALKALRGVKSSERNQKRFEHEIEFWAKLNHPNILAFYGIVIMGHQIHIVSPWQNNGNLLDYVKRNPDTNHNVLLYGSAAGLDYLHSNSVVHGNVRCANVLISEKGVPKICDFGMSKIMEEVTEISASKTLTSEAGSARYVAPEIIESSDTTITKASDTYSFAMLILECVTKQPPFPNLRRTFHVIQAVVDKKEHPPRPVTPEASKWITEEVYSLMMRCWSISPDNRPTMQDVCKFFSQRAT